MIKNIKDIYRILGKYKWYYIFSTVLLLVSIIARALEPKVLQVAVDNVISKYISGTNLVESKNNDIVSRFFDYLLPKLNESNFGEILLLLGLIYMAISLLRSLFLFVSSAIKHHSTQSTIFRLRNTMFNHIQHLPLSFFSTISKGELMQRCTGDVDTIKDFIDQQIINFLRLSTTFIFSFIMMYFIHPTYAFYSVCLAPLIFVLSYYFFKKEIAVWEAHEKEADKLNSMVQENLNGIRVVAAFSNQEFEIQRFKKQNEAKMKMGVKQAKLQAYFWPLTDLICNIQIVISVIIGGYFTLQGAISVGELLGFNSYLGMVTMPMRHLGRILSRMGIALVAMERISEIIEKPLEEDLGEIKSGNLSGKIEFKNVSFTYDGKQNVLEDVSFIIPSASQVAIIGESGSGKSTIIKLLLRFYEPTHGEILIDDIPIQKYNKSFLRAQIGSAFQKAFLFSSTIQQNINYTKMDAMEDEIDAAAAVAQAIEMKHKFNKGFNTLVGERGVTLSGGQKQRVALARTILANPTIIVLDDTTSAVDTITEKRILNELDNSLKGKTAIIIANRIASIQKASWIIVLDKGKVAQQGSQKDLLKNSDFYQSIQDIQSHLEEEIQLEIAN